MKQTPLEEDYRVVDNKKGDHRYKYDQKKQYIEKKQIEEAAEVASIMEQTPETLVPTEEVPVKQEHTKSVEK